MKDSLMSQGVDLMLYGMGTVLIFLALLVLATLAMSWLIQRFFPEQLQENSAPLESAPAYPDARLLTVIKAAIEQHRKRN